MKEIKTFSEWYFEIVGLTPDKLEDPELQIMYFHYVVQCGKKYTTQSYATVKELHGKEK